MEDDDWEQLCDVRNDDPEAQDSDVAVLGFCFEHISARPEPHEPVRATSQKNILGEQMLGLPGEPRVDKELPWSKVPRS